MGWNCGGGWFLSLWWWERGERTPWCLSVAGFWPKKTVRQALQGVEAHGIPACALRGGCWLAGCMQGRHWLKMGFFLFLFFWEGASCQDFSSKCLSNEIFLPCGCGSGGTLANVCALCLEEKVKHMKWRLKQVRLFFFSSVPQQYVFLWLACLFLSLLLHMWGRQLERQKDAS